MKIVLIIVIMLILFADLICYAACVVAGRADEREREMWEREHE